jgi:hypothetical protein
VWYDVRMRHVAVETIEKGKGYTRIVLAIGDDLESNAIEALRTKIRKRYDHLHGGAKLSREHMRKVEFVTVRYALLHYRELREQLKYYDMEYYNWRIDVETRKELARVKKVGIRFVEYTNDSRKVR